MHIYGWNDEQTHTQTHYRMSFCVFSIELLENHHHVLIYVPIWNASVHTAKKEKIHNLIPFSLLSICFNVCQQPVCQSKCVTGKGITLILIARISEVFKREKNVLKFFSLIA